LAIPLRRDGVRCTTCAIFVFDEGVARRICGAFTVPAEEDDELERLSLRPDEKIADLAREHDAVVRRVDPLIAKLGGRFAQPFVGVLQILR
jgi:hypothetical protein